MDRVLRYPGGQPVRSQDLEFIQDAFKKSIAGLSKMFGSKFILYGALDGGKTNVIEGAVVIDGEVYEVPSLGAIGNNTLCFRSSDSDEREFFNGQPHKVYRKYEAYLSTDTGNAAAFIDLKGAARPIEDIEEKINALAAKLPDYHYSTSAQATSSRNTSYATYTFNDFGETTDDIIIFHAEVTLNEDIKCGFSGCVQANGVTSFVNPTATGTQVQVNYSQEKHQLIFISGAGVIKDAKSALIVCIKNK